MKHKVFALFGAVAMLLTATVALTLPRATPFASSIGGLKCYDLKGEIEKCAGGERAPNVRHARLD